IEKNKSKTIRPRTGIWQFGWILALVLAMAGSAYAQVGSASLSGVVEDPTGAVIPGSAVTLVNTQNNERRTTASTGRGEFTFAAVPVGDYNLIVKHAGFTTYIQSGLHLNAGDNKLLNNIKLAVGSEAQGVTVESTVAGLPLDSGELSSTITSNDIQRLSIVGRDVTELQRVLPGFAIRNTSSTNEAPDFSQVQIGQPTPYASNGAPVAGITLELDGANLTDPGNFG